MSVIVGSRVFTAGDQQRFAALSGDFNPMHVDPVAARRVGAGAPIVHGVHNLLWCLECVAPHCPGDAAIESLKVDFSSFLAIDESVEVRLVSVQPTRLRAEVFLRGISILVAIIGFGDKRRPGDAQRPDTTWAPSAVLDTSEDAMAGLTGRVPFAAPAEAMAEAFPQATRVFGAGRLAALGACTRLIGMICPGLNSIFNRIALDSAEDDGRDDIGFAVNSVNLQYRHVRTAVWGAGWSGSLTSSIRHRPAAQPTMHDVSRLVAQTEFALSVALVVGGSRGIGEVAAKLIAAGGGHPVITYASGADDAARVAAEIQGFGGRCDVLRLDVRQPIAEQLESLPVLPNQLLYFSTPMIGRRSQAVFDPERLAELVRFYVDGFHASCMAVLARGAASLTAFYPSTVFVEERPPGLTEYAMAKAAAEMLCRGMTEDLPSFRAVVARLPRLATDQNPGLEGEATIAEVLLPSLRAMQGD